MSERASQRPVESPSPTWTGTVVEGVPRQAPASPLLDRIARILRRKLSGNLQIRIASECRAAFHEARRAFPARVILPTRYGRYLPERVVELLLARLLYQPGMKVLDVGHANGMECHRAMIESLPEPRDLTGIDIAQAASKTSACYARSVRASIHATPFEDQSFDLIWCISSLEHVGMDNSAYVADETAAQATPEAALLEMVRLLRPRGSLLVTVPYGRHEDHGWFRNYDETRLKRLLDPLRRVVSIRELYYAHTAAEGWRATEPERLRNVGYADQDNAGAAALAALLITTP